MKNADTLEIGLLSDLSEYISKNMGLYFPQARWDVLFTRMADIAKDFDFQDTEEFIKWLMSVPATRTTIEMVAKHLTISEIYFFREPHLFEALISDILPDLIRKREKSSRQIRIWSAGCATGEEPYTIAIILEEMIPDLENWHVNILATDINSASLVKAVDGLYGEWAFRNAPQGFKEKNFTLIKKGEYAIDPKIKKNITFKYLNLVDDVYPSLINNTNAMDIIFCRNVLMYFTQERIKTIGKHFYDSLVENGCLIVGSSELSNQLFPQFTCVNFPGAAVFKKESKKASLKIKPDFKIEPIPFEPAKINTEKSQDSSFRQPVSDQIIKAATIIREAVQDNQPDKIIDIRSLANLGKLDEALSACESMIKTNKLDLENYYLYANILQEQNRVPEAIAAFKRVLYLDQNYVLAHFSLGNLEFRSGNPVSAKKHFKIVLQLLNGYSTEDILIEPEMLTAGRLNEIITSILQMLET